MEDTTLKQLQPFIWGCNLFGFTYILPKSTFPKGAEIFIGAPVIVLYIFCVYKYITAALLGNIHYISHILKIADPLLAIVGVLTFFTRWMYYFHTRNKTKKVIFEVLYCCTTQLFLFPLTTSVLGGKTANKLSIWRCSSFTEKSKRHIANHSFRISVYNLYSSVRTWVRHIVGYSLLLLLYNSPVDKHMGNNVNGRIKRQYSKTVYAH